MNYPNDFQHKQHHHNQNRYGMIVELHMLFELLCNQAYLRLRVPWINVSVSKVDPLS